MIEQTIREEKIESKQYVNNNKHKTIHKNYSKERSNRENVLVEDVNSTIIEQETNKFHEIDYSKKEFSGIFDYKFIEEVKYIRISEQFRNKDKISQELSVCNIYINGLFSQIARFITINNLFIDFTSINELLYLFSMVDMENVNSVVLSIMKDMNWIKGFGNSRSKSELDDLRVRIVDCLLVLSVNEKFYKENNKKKLNDIFNCVETKNYSILYLHPGNYNNIFQNLMDTQIFLIKLARVVCESKKIVISYAMWKDLAGYLNRYYHQSINSRAYFSSNLQNFVNAIVEFKTVLLRGENVNNYAIKIEETMKELNIRIDKINDLFENIEN